MTCRLSAAVAALALGMAAGGCAGNGDAGDAGDARGSSGSGSDLAARQAAVQRVKGPVLVAAGDIACPPGQPVTPSTCQQSATAGLAARLRPQAIAILGDIQYDVGALAAFHEVFARSWGRLRRLRPAPGNHEYGTRGASGYFDYFGPVAGPGRRGWYSYNLGGWHLVSLNSNCSLVGCAPGGAQQRWLAADLAANRARCTIAYWHHPLFSSGLHGDDPAVRGLWRTLAHWHADIVLSGHDHHYERFAPQTPGGRLNRAGGIREFVVGTGGRSLYQASRGRPNSEAVDTGEFGVLALTLGSGRYAWRFITTGGRTRDAGVGGCH